MPQAGIFPWSQPMPHTHQNVGQGGKLSEYSDVFNLADSIADVLTNHTKAVHDALAINADQVDGVEGAEILQRDGSVPLTAAWTAGDVIACTSLSATLGGSIKVGDTAGYLRLVRDAAEIAKFLGVSNAICGLKISKAIIGAFELNTLIANNKVPDADTVDAEHAAAITTNARVKAHFPDTIANILSNHTKAVHDALKIEGAYLTAPTELTINAGAITVTQNYHKVDGEGDAADTLSTINGGVGGQILVIQSENAARDITVDEAGNIFLTGPNCVLADPACKLILIYDLTNTVWTELGRCTG